MVALPGWAMLAAMWVFLGVCAIALGRVLALDQQTDANQVGHDN